MAHDLTVRSLQGRAVSVPMKRPLGTSAQTIREAPLLLLDLVTEEGITGRSYLFCYMPSVAGAILEIVDGIAAQIKGDPVSPLEISAKLTRQYRLVGVPGVVAMAQTALGVACWEPRVVPPREPPRASLCGTPKTAFPHH